MGHVLLRPLDACTRRPLHRSMNASAPSSPAHCSASALALLGQLDPDLFPIFEEEAARQLPHLRGILQSWIGVPPSFKTRHEALHLLHTLKNSAWLTGAREIGDIAQRLEAAIQTLPATEDNAAAIAPLLADCNALQAKLDALHAAAEAIARSIATANLQGASSQPMPLPAPAPSPIAPQAAIPAATPAAAALQTHATQTPQAAASPAQSQAPQTPAAAPLAAPAAAPALTEPPQPTGPMPPSPTPPGSAPPASQQPATPSAPQPAPKARARWLKRLLWLLLGLVLALALLIGALLVWASRDGSLPRALQLAQRFLPADQALHYEGASGSLTAGGRIQRLHWHMPGTALEIDGLHLDWDLWQLLERALHVRTLHAERVRVLLSPQPEPAQPPAPAAMPAHVRLPIAIRLPLRVDRLEVQPATTPAKPGSPGTPAAPTIYAIDQLAADYHYATPWHALQLQSLHYGASQAQAELRLHDTALTLQAQLGAWLSALSSDVHTPLPAPLHAWLSADGSLAGGDAAMVQLRLDAHEQAPNQAAPKNLLQTPPSPSSAATRAHLQATLHPWRSQPVQQAHVELAGLNARALHPAAPETDLHGRVDITPAATAHTALADAAWALQARLENRRPGPWAASAAPPVAAADPSSAPATTAARLPVRHIDARLHYRPAAPTDAPAGAPQAPALHIEQAAIDLHGSAPAGRITLEGKLHPTHLPASALQLQLQALNLQPLMAGLPETALSGNASARPANTALTADLAQAEWDIEADIRNAQPGLLDAQRLPLTQLLAQAHIAPERWSAHSLQARVGEGQLQLQGHFEPATQALHVQAELQRLPLVRLHSQLAAEQAPPLSGTLQAQGDLRQGIAFEADIRSHGATVVANPSAKAAPARSPWDVRAIQTQGRWQPDALVLERLTLNAFQAQVQASKLHLSLPDASQVQATVSARAPGLSLSADAAMQAASGGGKLSLQLASAQDTAAWLRGLPIVGAALPALQASGSAQLDAQWQGGWQQWLEGLQNPARHPQLRIDAHAHSAGLKLSLPASAPAPAAKAGATQAQGKKQVKAAKTTKPAQTSQAPAAQAATQIDIRQLDARLQGNLAAASFSLKGDALANGAHAKLDTRAQLAQTGAAQRPIWRVTLAQWAAALTLPGQKTPWQWHVEDDWRFDVQTQPTLALRAQGGQARVTPPASVTQGAASQALTLRWEPLQFTQTANGALRLQSRGQLKGLALAWLDGLAPDNPPLAGAGVRSTLMLSGQWDIDLGDTARVSAELGRDSGDVWLGDSAAPVQAAQGQGATASASKTARAPRRNASDALAAGLRDVRLRLQSSGDALNATLLWDAERAGQINAQAHIPLARKDGGWSLPEPTPLGGHLRASLPDLGVWGALAPLGWRIGGALKADIQLAGTLQAPQLQGPIQADGLSLRSVLDGVDLHDGRLRAQLQGERLLIEELVFQGGTGSNAYVPGRSGNRTPAPTERGHMRASGHIDWSGVRAQADGSAGSGIAMEVQARLEAMQALARNDRQISLSGPLSATLRDGALRVRGDITIDRASITLPESGAPTLGSDVVVVRASDAAQAAAEAAADALMPRGELQTAKPMDMHIQLNLGRDFALQGYGITTRLEGELDIRNTTRGKAPISIVGEVRTDEGRYRAWGQALNVEQGVVRFNGPYDNPSLDMLAIRPDIDVRAGVRITGTAKAPRVKLYSEPPLPESEALSWVVLGRSPGSGGGSGSQAMQQAALGLLAGSLGGGLAKGLGLDEVGLSDGGLSVGKRLSDQLYVTYVASLSGAAGTLYVFYDITRRLTARGETGTTSAVDLIYTVTYD